MKRILLIAGAAKSLINFRGVLICELIGKGLEVHVAAPDLTSQNDVAEKLRSWGVVLHDLNISRTGLNPLYDGLTLFELCRLARKLRPEYILSYTIKPVIYGTLAAWIAGVPNRFALITGLGYAFIGKATGKRAIISFFARKLYRLSLSHASTVFFQNPDDEALFRKLNILPRAIPSAVVNGSGIDLEEFKPASIPDGPVRFLLIGRLLADKGVREYIAAARLVREKHSEVQFDLVGDLDDNPESIGQAELDHWVAEGIVNYLGRLNDVRPAIEAASVYILPSYREGTPRTTLEAMAMGRPVITTDAPGCRETVKSGYNGFLVPVKSVSKLEEAMLKFVRDPGIIRKMGRNSIEFVTTKYDVHYVNEQMLSGMGLAK